MCFALDNLDSGSFCIWDAPSSIIRTAEICYGLWHPLTISAGVTTPSVGIWHWAWAASYIKPLGFWASTGQCVLCTSIWLFCFPGTITDWFPASPLVSLRGSDEHGINLLFSFLTPIKLKINTPSQNTKEAQEKSAFTWGMHTLFHIIISGTWNPFPIQMTQLQGKSEFSPEFIQNRSMSPNETTSKSSAWGFAQYKVRKKAFQAHPLISPTHFQEFCSYKITAPGRGTLHCTEKWLD